MMYSGRWVTVCQTDVGWSTSNCLSDWCRVIYELMYVRLMYNGLCVTGCQTDVWLSMSSCLSDWCIMVYELLPFRLWLAAMASFWRVMYMAKLNGYKTLKHISSCEEVVAECTRRNKVTLEGKTFNVSLKVLVLTRK